MIKKELRELKEEVIKCRKCSLSKTRTLPVIGQGNHKAEIIFIGEGPGLNEDRTGVPFCGQSGDVLDELFESIGYKREDAYVCNILKCRPPNNRNPEKKEIEACAPYLERQIEIIQPKIIATLGNYATGFILEKYGLEDRIEGISKIHGKVFQAGGVKIIPLYHPAVAVYNANMKETLKKDFKILSEILDAKHE
ncbi:MAG: uracil-DNA glycosylase [Candidatus Portnoybacteria bacterium]